MVKIATKVLVLAFAITAGSAAIAIATNAVRPSGIPLVTDIPYEIFAPCKDSEAEAKAASAAELAGTSGGVVLYIDARPAEMFEAEHIEGSINVPYSALFGAKPEDVEKVKTTAQAKKATKIVVYGLHQDAATEKKSVDFGKPLAQQLVESGIKGVTYLAGGLTKLKESGQTTTGKGSAPAEKEAPTEKGGAAQ